MHLNTLWICSLMRTEVRQRTEVEIAVETHSLNFSHMTVLVQRFTASGQLPDKYSPKGQSTAFGTWRVFILDAVCVNVCFWGRQWAESAVHFLSKSGVCFCLLSLLKIKCYTHKQLGR